MRSCNVRNTPHKINAVPKKETVNVVCRVRPLSNEERRQAVPKCLDIRSNNVIIRKGNKTQEFSFNEVFSPKSTQHDVYKSCVEPMIHDACAGYSCTLFAYGQTGTGKTFTLEGAKSQSAESTVPHRTADSIDPKAGIIPRAMFHLLKHLSKYPQNRFSVTVSIVELYNEKLIDLLGKDQDIENESRAIKIYEKDGEPTISNVQLEQVTNQEDVFRLLSIAGARRKTAETKMNAQSSRSHCIFRATVNLQQEDNNNMTTGTLFLVDLAGSENIGRSGAKDKRAKEAGNINKSLCSLGRVITSLVEGNKHIPYRESLLTRLLQNSLGGKCKTTMVVCISPSKADYDETMNTLDYGRRAQNIKNSPEICETHNMTLEMSRMQQQLELQTNKNGGVTVTKDRFEELTGKAEAYDQLYNEHELQQSQHQELLEAKEELDLLHKDLKEKYGYESFCRRHLDGISDRQLDQSTMLLNAGEQLLTTIKKLNQIKQQISDMFSKNLKLSQKTKNSIEEKANTCRQLLSKNVDQAITEYKKIISSDEDTRGNEIENLKNISNNNNSEILNLLKNLRTALENYENIGKENFENLSKINKKFEEKIADQKSNFDENFKNLKEGQLDSTVGNIGDQRKQFYEFLTKKGEEFDLFAKALKDSGERFDDKGKVILEKGKTEFLKGLFDMHWFFGLVNFIFYKYY